MSRAKPTIRLKRDAHGAAHARRRRLLMRQMGKNGFALLAAAEATVHSNDVEHRYRPDNDFYYLTGFPEPSAVAVLAPGHASGAFWLVVRPRDPQAEVWIGPRSGLEDARVVHGADRALGIEQCEAVVDEVLARASTLFQIPGQNAEFDHLVSKVMARRRRAGKRNPRRFQDLRPLLHEMRLRKDEVECARMARAATISAGAHREAMAVARPGLHEYQVEAHIDHVFRDAGTSGPAYPTIVGSGPNGVVLHHVENRRRMRSGDLVLVDAGCELDCYTSDVTRTFPVDGKFRPPQQRLYEVVLGAQKAAIASIRPGVSMDRPHQVAAQVLSEGLSELGILPGSGQDVLSTGSYRKFFMHRTSHWLGMDVHDVGGRIRNGRVRRLAAGMVLTVEPGLYIGSEETGSAVDYAGMGIRIEDDVLVTADGHRVLSAAAPRTPAAVERACKQTPRLGV
jgi:Xaa-Pro aminopeptidase